MVTICTTSLTFNNSTFCSHTVFMCFVWISEQPAIISLYNINWLLFIKETQCVYCAVRTGCLYIIHLYFANKILSFSLFVRTQIFWNGPLKSTYQGLKTPLPPPICCGNTKAPSFDSFHYLFPCRIYSPWCQLAAIQSLRFAKPKVLIRYNCKQWPSGACKTANNHERNVWHLQK